MIENLNAAKKELEQGQVVFEKGLNVLNRFMKSDKCPEGNKKELEEIMNEMLMAGATNDQDKIKEVISKLEIISNRSK